MIDKFEKFGFINGKQWEDESWRGWKSPLKLYDGEVKILLASRKGDDFRFNNVTNVDEAKGK